MINEDILLKAKPRNCSIQTDAEPQGSPLGLTTWDQPQRHLPLEVGNQLAPGAGCYICVDRHWKGTQGTTHQKTSQLFGGCKRRVRFRNPRSYMCFVQEHDLMKPDFQSFSLSFPPFRPILHSMFQAHSQPLVPPPVSHPEISMDSPTSLGNTRQCQ